jgi:flavorubredoxin
LSEFGLSNKYSYLNFLKMRRCRMAKVLIVYYSLGGNTEAAAKAVEKGAREVAGTQVILKNALKATVDDLIDCDALAVGTPDYFSYMAGGLKDFFDRTYYPTQGKVTDKPCFAFVTCGGGGKAVESVEVMCQRFKFKEVSKPLLIKGKPDSEAEKQLREAGKRLAMSDKC